MGEFKRRSGSTSPDEFSEPLGGDKSAALAVATASQVPVVDATVRSFGDEGSEVRPGLGDRL